MRALAALLLLLAAPAGSAWTSHGQREPDTAYDLPDLMWQDAPAPGAARVYFNAFPTMAGTDANPNVGALGTRVRPSGAVSWEAILGIWNDCNGDGAIGLLESGSARYPAVLLLDAERCPPASAHRDGEMVDELLDIGPGAPADVIDPDAIVWGDLGPPGAAGLEACRVLPLPRGATSHTGRALRALDCASEHRLIGLVNAIDNDGSLGLRIEDQHHPEESDSALSRRLPLTLYDADEEGILPDETPRIEDAHEPTSHTGRDANDVVLAFAAPPAPPRVSLEPWRAASPRTQEAEPRWRALAAFTTPPQLVSRADLEPEGGRYWTFHAHVGAATVASGALLPGGGGTYGSEACAGETTGAHRGWVCEPALWWRDPYGDAMPRDAQGRALGARVQQRYELRDVDCEDGTFDGSMGLGASLILLSDRPCPPRP